MSTGHTHALPSNRNEHTLRIALGLTFGFLLAEVIGGIVTGSLALISGCGPYVHRCRRAGHRPGRHRIARRPADVRRTYGYHRFEILAAAFNALLLFAVALYILFEAYQRFRNPPEIQSTGMLVIATIGLVVNMISIRLLSGGKDSSLN